MMDEEKTLLSGDDAPSGDSAGVEECPHCGESGRDADGYCVECGLDLGLHAADKFEEESLPSGDVLVRITLPDGTAQEFPAGTFQVGRTGAELTVPDPYVSRTHAEIEVGEGRLKVTDRGSTNGTFVNGERLTQDETREIATGDTITFGQTDVSWEFVAETLPEEEAIESEDKEEVPDEEPAEDLETVEEEEPSDEMEPDEAEETAADEGGEEALEEASAISGWVLSSESPDIGVIPLREGETVMGRKAERVDYAIQSDGYISGRHCSISVSGGEVTLTDLESTNGTFLDGERLEPNEVVPVSEGALIQIGETKFTLQRTAPADHREEEE